MIELNIDEATVSADKSAHMEAKKLERDARAKDIAKQTKLRRARIDALSAYAIQTGHEELYSQFLINTDVSNVLKRYELTGDGKHTINALLAIESTELQTVLQLPLGPKGVSVIEHIAFAVNGE